MIDEIKYSLGSPFGWRGLGRMQEVYKGGDLALGMCPKFNLVSGQRGPTAGCFVHKSILSDRNSLAAIDCFGTLTSPHIALLSLLVAILVSI